MALAIFDLDETLISGDSDHEWGSYLAASGLVDAEEHGRQNDRFFEQYKAGELDIDAYLRFSFSVLKTHPPDVLNRHLAEYVHTRVTPMILDRARELVENHRRAGDHLMVITSTSEFVTRPIVDLFGIETLIAPVPEFVDNHYTGEVEGIPSFAEGKVTRLKLWLESTNHDLDGSYFYSDSHNDLPLLRLVDYPVAVDPDDILRAEAEARQWRIISLR